VLERYPNLRIGLGESGVGWLPLLRGPLRDLMKLKPSELAPTMPGDFPTRPDCR